MPGFGRFETVEELASSGPFAVFSARPAGEVAPPAFAIKIYRTSDMFADADVIEREAGAFLEAAKLQQSLPAGSLKEGGEGHWAKIYELGRTEEATYYVTDLYTMTAQRMVDSRRELDARSLAWIIGGVVDGLAELGAKANGRGHGGLTNSNVLIAVGEEIEGSQVALTDPEPDSRLDSRSQAQDLRDLAALIFQLVIHRAPPKGGEIRTSPEWQRMGNAGELLRSLCEQLLNPQAGAQLTFEQIKEKLKACLAVKEPSKGGMSLGVKIAIGAAVLLLAGGGAFFAMRSSGPPADPITPDWMTAQVQTVSGKLAAATKKANDNNDDAREAEATALETQLKAAQNKIETLRQHPMIQSEAELRSLLAKKGDSETELADLEKKIDALSNAIVVIDPGQDPRPAAWMDKPLGDLNDALAAVVKDMPTEGEGGPDVAALRQQVEAFKGKVDAVKAKPWLADGAEPAARNQAQEEIRKGVKDAVAEQKTIKTILAKAHVQAREQLDKYLADQRQLNRNQKIVTSDALQEAFAIGIDAINLNDQSLGWEAVKTTVANLTSWLKGLEADLPASLDVKPPAGSAMDLQAAQRAVDTKREHAFSAAVEPMTKGRTMPGPDDAAKRAKIKEDFTTYVAGVKQELADASEIERLLSLGYAFTEQPQGGKSIQTLRAEVSSSASYAEVRGAVDTVLQRAADLEQVSTLTDGVRLMGLITSAGQSAGSVSPVMAAWKKLPKAGFPAVPGDLDRAADLLNNTIIPALKNVGDPARKTALEDQAKGAAREMWFAYLYEKAAGKPDAINAAFAAAPKLEVHDADLSTLEPWAAYDLERWRLLNQVITVKDPDPKAQLAAIQKMVQEFQTRVAGKNLGNLEAVKAMAVRLKPFADGKDLDLAHEGPGRIPWKNAAGPEWSAQANDDGTIVTYSWKGPGGRPYALEFRRVFEDPAGESNGYLCTTEMSLGLFIDLVQRAEKWDELHTIVSTSDPDSRHGPRVWEWPPSGKMRPSEPIPAPRVDKTGNGWLRPGTTDDMEHFLYYPQGMAIPVPPTVDDPVNYISPVAALYVSHLAYCRLPSTVEWTKALEKDPPADADTNRRDKLWSDEHAYLSDPDPATGKSIFDKSNRNAELPSAGIFRPKGITKAAVQDKDAVTVQDDKYLWFAPVAKGGGKDFHHLIGNVAEYVFEDPKALDKLPADLPANVVRPALGKGDLVHVIGASALSPKDYDPKTPGDPKTPFEVNISQSIGGYSDVGFRLAFSTGGGGGGTGKPAERLAKILSQTDYLARATK